jgi:DNA ligase D-like protein (predicted polymerase)
MPAKREVFHIAGRDVALTNPDKVFFPDAGYTKRDLFLYYQTVAAGALRGIRARPIVLKRFPDGIARDAFFQKRVGEHRPDWIETAKISFPSGRTAEELVVRDAAALGWMINLGCVDLNPHPVRADDLDHPDELRVDLDPVPGVGWRQILDVARVVKEVLDDVGLVGWPKTSGSRGVHVYARIERRWGGGDVRRAALALAREVERRAPEIATSKWWKEERRGVFLDYNQNAKDRTVASAYSVRPIPDARVSMPLGWDELLGCDPADYTLATVPEIFAKRGDAHEGIDEAAGSLDALLALAREQERGGMSDAPWPPPNAKQRGEPRRAPPSKVRAARGTGTRPSKMPLVIVARAAKKDDALDGLARWKARHPEAARLLHEDDVLVDAMRGRFTVWWRIRVNLRHVPEAERPPAEPPDPDYQPSWR